MKVVFSELGNAAYVQLTAEQPAKVVTYAVYPSRTYGHMINLDFDALTHRLVGIDVMPATALPPELLATAERIDTMEDGDTAE